MYVVSLKNGEEILRIHGRKQKLKNGNVVQGINAIDSFSFCIFLSNTGFKKIYDYKSLVSVYDTNKKRYEFYGRVLRSTPEMKENGEISKEVICESYLGFFCDSEQYYVQKKEWVARALFEYIVTVHNEQVEEHKRFIVGEINVEGADEIITVEIPRKSTWNVLQEKLIEEIGGEVRFRVVNDVNYIDYLEQIGEEKTTPIKVSKNMKTIKKQCDPSDIITRLIPLGSKLTDDEGNATEERLDISSVNNGLNYIESNTAKDIYGIRVAHEIFDGITDASELFDAAQSFLIKNNRALIKYTAKALDLSLIGIDIDDFQVANRYPVVNALLNIDDVVRVSKKKINICNPVESTIEFGDNFKALSDVLNEQKTNVVKIEDKISASDEEIEKMRLLAKTSVKASDLILNSTPKEIISINFAATEDVMPLFIATIPVIMDTDGNLVLEYRIDGTTVTGQTVTKYLERGTHFVTLSNYFSVNKNDRRTLTVMAHVEYFESDSRIQNAKILSILDYISTGTYTEQAIDTTIPSATIPAEGIRAVLFAQGLAATNTWDGTINLTDTVGLFTIQNNTLLFNKPSDTVQAETQEPTASGITETVALFTIASGPTFNAPTDRPLLGYVIKYAIRSVDNPAEWTFEDTYINTGDGKFALSTLYTYTSEEQEIDSGRMCSVTIRTDDKVSVEGVVIK